MKAIKTNGRCRDIRDWLTRAISKRTGPKTDWIQNHIANCPRCQRRAAHIGKVGLAISIIKAEPHNLDLLMRANARAIGVLKHSLREGPKAEKLRSVQPEPKLLERFNKYKRSVANSAACIMILFLMKTSVFSSMEQFDARGRTILKQYYTTQAGEDLADQIFS